MIVPSMTVQEIHNEVFEDIKNLQTKLDECRKDFRKTVLKSSLCPLTKSYDCKTREKKNLFIVTYTEYSRQTRPVIPDESRPLSNER